MIHLGDRLGLYRALDGAGPVTAAELAGTTGLHERWLLEWLRGPGRGRAARVGGRPAVHPVARRDGGAGRRGRQPLLRGRGLRPAGPQSRARRRPGRRLPHGCRPAVRPARAGGGPPDRALARALGPPGAGAEDPARPRRGGAEARGGGVGGRRRVRRRGRPAGDGRALPGVTVRGLRPVDLRHRAGPREGGGGRRRQRRAGGGPGRGRAGGGRLRPGAHLRLPARHDRSRRRPGRHPSVDRRRRDAARQGHPQLARLRRQPAQPPAGHDVRLLGPDVHVVGPLRARRRRPRHAGLQPRGGRAHDRPRRASPASRRTTSPTRPTCTTKSDP